MKFGILPWLERGHAFTQNIKNHLFCIKNQMGIPNLRTILTARACRTGCWAARTCRPCWPGASWDGGIPLTRWGHSPYEMGTFPLPDGCGVPGLLPGVDHWIVSSDNLDGSRTGLVESGLREWEKGKDSELICPHKLSTLRNCFALTRGCLITADVWDPLRTLITGKTGEWELDLLSFHFPGGSAYTFYID